MATKTLLQKLAAKTGHSKVYLMWLAHQFSVSMDISVDEAVAYMVELEFEVA